MVGPKVIQSDECFKIIGACFEVYNNKGCGFLEPVYQECLQIELGLQGIPAQAQQELSLTYKEHPLTCKYKADFICFGNIILELKAIEKLASVHEAQVINYLHATGFKLGLLVNFGHYPNLEWKRIVV